MSDLFKLGARVGTVSFITFCCLKIGLAQSSNDLSQIDIFPPTPEAASLGKYNEIPVSNSSGIPSINIPIYELKSNNLNLNIGLSYHAGGIKVEDIASRVGLGWSLNAGGIITRSMRGLPDDHLDGFLNSSIKPSEFIPGDQYSYDIAQSVIDDELDFEQDVFNYNFNGFSGSFFFNENQEPQFAPASDIKVSPIFDSINKIIGWILITPNGTQYYFGISNDKSRTGTDLTRGILRQGSFSISPSSGYHTSWYLMDIINYNKTDSIQLSYDKHIITYCNSESETRSWKIGDECPQTPNYTPMSYMQTDSQVSILERITTSENVVKFIDGEIRQDLNNSYELGSIIILNKDSLQIKKFDLEYDYYLSNLELQENITPCSSIDERTKRLKLNSITEVGRDGIKKPSTTFSYNTDPLPERFSYSMDYWGYYNGAANSTLIPSINESTGSSPVVYSGADRTANGVISQAGILERIIYPEGGSDSFIYEGNMASWNSNSGINNYETKQAILNSALTTNDPNIFEFNFTISDRIRGAVNWDINYLSCDLKGFDCIIFDIIDNSNPNSKTNLNSFVGNLPLPASNYTIRAITVNTSIENADNFELKLTWNELEDNNIFDTPVGGLRVKKIVTNDGYALSKTRTYNYNLFSNSAKTSGLLASSPKHFWSQFSACDVGPCQLFMYSSASQSTLATVNASPVCYTNVEVIYGEPDTNIGKTRYYYNFEFDGSDGQDEYPMVPTIQFDWRRGLLLKREDFDSSDKIVKSEVSRYKFLKDSQDFRNSLVVAYKITGNSHFGCYKSYFNYAEAFVLEENAMVTYPQQDQLDPVSTYTRYNYDHLNIYLNPTSVTRDQSDGKRSISEYVYTKDNPNSFSEVLTSEELEAKERLDNLNVIQVLEEIDLIQSDENSKRISRRKSAYRVDNDKVLLNNEQSSLDSEEYEIDASFLKYNENGKILEWVSRDGIHHSVIWDENSHYPLMHAVGANIDQVFHTSFENSGSEDVSAKTGDKVFIGSSYSVPFDPPDDGLDYKMSYWFWSNGSWNFSGEIPFSNIISQGTRLDEIRVYPKYSQLTTYTYIPQIGVSTVTDYNNFTSYYEYDSFNRLKIIKDADNNIIKHYQYKYHNE